MPIVVLHNCLDFCTYFKILLELFFRYKGKSLGVEFQRKAHIEEVLKKWNVVSDCMYEWHVR